MVAEKASDLHLVVPNHPVLRRDGELVEQTDLAALNATSIKEAFDSITTPIQRQQFEKDLELDFAYSMPGLGRFRVSAITQRGTLALAFRLVPFDLPTIDSLGIPAICKDLILKRRGLILVTGPAGSGKSTTLGAMIKHLNQTEKRNILTVEDPIEFLFKNEKCLVLQRELGGDTHSFSTALVHALRHDPDVIIIGEMRDLATMSAAVTSAETGHLVIGTLHTGDAAQSIDRMVDVFPPTQQRQVRLQLSQVLLAVLTQRLLPRIGGGRVAAFEILLNNSVISRLIREERNYEILANMEVSQKDGMQTMDQALAKLVKNGIASREEAFMASSDPVKFEHQTSY